jgi:hypothetical protein
MATTIDTARAGRVGAPAARRGMRTHLRDDAANAAAIELLEDAR